MTATLTTMAILKANWDEKRDYLSNFQPFVNDVLRKWPEADAVEPGAIAVEVKTSWGIDIPAMTIKTMVDRAARAGLLERTGSAPALFTIPEALASSGVDLTKARDDALRNMNALIDEVVRHAEQHGVTWTPGQAEAALMGYLEEFGSVFAARRRAGGWQQKSASTEAINIVHSLARQADERNPQVLDWLEEAVKGSMLANVLHFENPTTDEGRLDKLIVYLDTSLVVRVLGVSVPSLVAAAREMLQLIGSVGASPRVFEHTMVEVEGVLRSVAQNLRSPRRQATRDTARMSWQRREVLDYFLSEQKTAADVEAILSTLDKQLLKLGIQTEPTPEHLEHLTLDESKLSAILREKINYRTAPRSPGNKQDGESNERIPALERDVDSLTAVHRLRKGRVFRSLKGCPAVFLTNNRSLSFASRGYFREEGLQAGVPHCYWEPELVTQLWIRTPSAAPDLPRKTILADSYAALNPSSSLWEKYVTRIEELEKDQKLTEDDVTSLIYSTTARSVLVDITRGDEKKFGDDTIGEVLNRATRELSADERERADKAESELATEKTQAVQELAAKDEQLRQRTAEVQSLNRRVDSMEEAQARLRRRSTYLPLAALSMLVAVLPWVAGWSDALVIGLDSAGVAGALLFGLAAFMPWRRSLEIGGIVITIVGIVGIVALVVTLARGRDNDHKGSKPAAQASTRRVWVAQGSWPIPKSHRIAKIALTQLGLRSH
jgi:hypothetical protein